MATRKKKSEQQVIPGTERVVHKDISRAAKALYEVRAERMELSEREGQLAAELMAAMKKHAISKYVDDDFEMTITAVEERVSVKRRKVQPDA